MKKLFSLLLVFGLALPSAWAQEAIGEGYSYVYEKKPSLVKRLVSFLERHELSGVDTNYIGVPKRKWAAFANFSVSDVDFSLKSNLLKDTPVGYGAKIGRVKIDMYSKLEEQVSLGLYFMGYGLSYSVALGKGYKKDLSFTMYSSPMGGELRYHSTNKFRGKIVIEGMGEEFDIAEGDAKMENFILNTYYVFNHRKFSYGAAMSHFKLQKKSSGSILAGLTINQTKLRAYDILLASLMGGVTKMQLRQLAIGAGYGYNWIPKQGLTIHLSEIPMILITTKSATKLDGEWSDSQKDMQKKLFGNKTRVSFTHVLRAGVSYEWADRYLVGLSGHYNYFKVGKRSSYHASTEDWNTKLFFAYRF